MKHISLAFLDKEFIRKFMSIAFPAMLMGLINFGVKAVDTLMLGLVGEVQLSASALANQFSMMFMIITFGIASGCSILIAQFWGADNKERVREIFAFMYRAIIILNLFFAAMAFFIPHYLMNILTTDQEVIAEGVIYLRIMSLGYLVWGFTNAGITALRSVRIVKMPVVVFSISLIISASLNYVLIFGHFGFPALGIAGAAIATVSARFVEIIIIAVYVLKFEKKLALRLHNLGKRSKGLITSFMKYGLPVVMNEVFWASGFFILNVIIGRIGREFVAANAIGGLLLQFVSIVIFSFASAASVITGNTIGEGRYDRAKQIANGMIIISFFVGILSFAFIQAIRVPFVNFYELSDTAHVYALQLTHIISVSVIFMSLDSMSMMGALRGGGDAKFVMVADVIFMWIISIPLGILTGLVMGWPVWIVFIILRSDSVFKTILVLWRVPKGKWLKDVTKA
ncbi:MAG: MATE family efflux transporter [Defluviitaleaceae bacterium]|nr:MATE family efflux transporter [Defluviitaleaceae bacterium]